ncbi:MAG: winged helix-turn-helix domain-containing protein, partial [Actinomycetota bacterium]
DMKADRHAGVLRVEGAYLERGVAAKSVAAPIAARLREMASWLGLDDVAVARRGSLATPLVALCK